MRLPRQVATAAELARRLAAHPAVSAVHYPGLPDHPEHELARRQMPAGAGGVLAFELADGAIAGQCEEAVRLVRNATSLGGVETLIERRARIEPEGRVPEGLLRLAVGLENVDDLWADLEQAIAAATARAPLRRSGASQVAAASLDAPRRARTARAPPPGRRARSRRPHGRVAA